MITNTISTDVLMTGAPLTHAHACAPAAWPAAAAVTGLGGHVSLEDATPATRDRITTPDVFDAVAGLPAWSPPT